MKKITAIILSVILILSCGFVLASAEDTGTARELIAVSHRSFSGTKSTTVLADFKAGADMVSVSVEKDSDGTLILSGTNENLDELISEIPDGKSVILDDCFEYAAEVDEIAKACGNTEKVYLRTDSDMKDILATETDCKVIGIYSGGIVFSAMKRAKNLSYVQFQSKNYFNPFYQSIVTKLFDKNNVAAFAPTYDPDLCGQRQDSTTGWDELVDRGYNAIETMNLEGLVEYIKEVDSQRKQLTSLLENCSEVDSEEYSQVSATNYNDAVTEALEAVDSLSSLAELENCYTVLSLAERNLTPAGGNETTRGAWNITAGKVIASVLCAAGLIGIELFMIKKRKYEGENK